MKAIRNKITKRLLKTELRFPSLDIRIDTPHLELVDSMYAGNIFVTSEEGVCEEILEAGYNSYPKISIDWGYSNFHEAFTKEDLEIVELKEL